MSNNLDAPLCRVCGEKLAQTLLTVTEPDRFERHAGISAVDYMRSWVECAGCGLVANIMQPENSELLQPLAQEYYKIDYANTTLGERFETVMGLPPEKSDNVGRVRRVLEFVALWHRDRLSDRAVLDVGAGLGVFLARLQEESQSSGTWEAVALEPDPLAAEHLRSIGSFAVISDVFPCALPQPVFHLVALNKVLEHVADPLTLVKELGTILHPECGVIHIEVPDKLTIGRRPPDDNILGALHCHLYDPRSLVSLIERAGLLPLKVERVLEPSGKITVFAFAALPSSVDWQAGAPALGI